MSLTPILMYHEVAGPGALANDVAPSWTVTAGQFRDHLARLDADGYTGLSVARWLEGHAVPHGRRPVVLTFDDGYQGNIQNAIPALRERGWTATFFLISGAIGTGSYARPEDWRAAAEVGMDIASHTATHPFAATLSRADARQELATSRAVLQEAIGRPVAGFSWPNGDAHRDGLALLRETGYAWAATSRAALARPGANPYALPRLAVRAWHGADGLAALISTGLAHRARMAGADVAKRLAKAALGRGRYAALQRRASHDG